VVVDDHLLVREGLKLLLGSESDLQVIGEAASLTELLQSPSLGEADVVLLDVTFPGDDGIQMLRAIRARRPQLKVVVLTMHRDAETVRQALAAGAAGYLVKGAGSRDLVEAIRAVQRGERYLHSSIAAAVVDDSIRWHRAGSGLSAREREILSLVGAGHPPATVAAMLGISIHTFRRHIANLSQKLGLKGINALTRYAMQHGLVRDEQ
jgi:DNA-binding NarL/FixJ family response regulator